MTPEISSLRLAKLFGLLADNEVLCAKVLSGQSLSWDELRSLPEDAKRALQEKTGYCIDGLPSNRRQFVFERAKERAFATLAERVTIYTGVGTWSELLDIFNEGTLAEAAKQGNACTLTCSFPDKESAKRFAVFIQKSLGSTNPRVILVPGNDVKEVCITGLEESDIAVLGRITASKFLEAIKDRLIFAAISGRTKREIDERGILVGTALPTEGAQTLEAKISENAALYGRTRNPGISPDLEPLITSPAFLSVMADQLRDTLGTNRCTDLQHATNPPGIEAGLNFPNVTPSSTERPISRTRTVGELLRAAEKAEIEEFLADARRKPVSFALDLLTSLDPIGLLQKLLGFFEGASSPLPKVAQDAFLGYRHYYQMALYLQKHSAQILCEVAETSARNEYSRRPKARSLDEYRRSLSPQEPSLATGVKSGLVNWTRSARDTIVRTVKRGRARIKRSG